MKRLIPLIILVLMFNSQKGVCDFTLQVNGFGVKKMVMNDGKILATDGRKLLLINEQGESLSSTQLDLDNSYLLQDAIYNQGFYYLLYQHSIGMVDFTLISLDDNLNPQWKKGYSNQGSTFGYAMTAKIEGGVVATGKSCTSGFFLFAVDENGNESWKKLYAQGNASALPGAITSNGIHYTVAYKSGSNLGLMKCDAAGNVTLSTVTSIPSDFYIKSMIDENGYAVLLNRPSVHINSIVSFTNSLQSVNRYDLSASSSLQLTSLAIFNGTYYVAGNYLQDGTNNLDMIYASINTSDNSVNAFATGAANSYDDAYSVKTYNNKIWVGGMIAGNGQITNLQNSETQLCSYQGVSLELQLNSCVSGNYNLVGNSLSVFDVVESVVTSSITVSAVNITCVVNTTSIEEPIHQVVSENSFNIYPNPATDHFNIDVIDASASLLKLYSATGQMVLQQKIEKGISNIDVLGLPSGIYMTVVSNNSGILQSKRLILLP